ncbi:hypothetical protein L7F22_000577 [Adiantum nelumboides]|nr:hypothetical protein [Adiantum nelumboides]
MELDLCAARPANYRPQAKHARESTYAAVAPVSSSTNCAFICSFGPRRRTSFGAPRSTNRYQLLAKTVRNVQVTASQYTQDKPKIVATTSIKHVCSDGCDWILEDFASEMNAEDSTQLTEEGGTYKDLRDEIQVGEVACGEFRFLGGSRMLPVSAKQEELWLFSGEEATIEYVINLTTFTKRSRSDLSGASNEVTTTSILLIEEEIETHTINACNDETENSKHVAKVHVKSSLATLYEVKKWEQDINNARERLQLKGRRDRFELMTKDKEESKKVALASSLLQDTAFLWWNRRVADDKRTPSWQKFRSAIRKAFEPANADFHGRSSLRRLSQTGSLAAYITEFQRLTQEIETLSPSDKLHSFIDGLEPNLKDDVHKFDPATLNAAIAYVERLGDNRRQGRNFFPGERSFNNNRSFQRDNRTCYSQNQQRSSQNYQPARQFSSGQFFGNQTSGQQSFRPRFSGQATPSQTGSSSNGFRNRGRPRQDRRRDDRRNFQRETTSGQHASTSSAPSTSQSTRSGLCTICGGNHRWYECPKRPNPSTTRRNTNMEFCPETEQCSTSTPDKGKQAVCAVRVSKVVSALMLNANTNVSVPVNLSNQVLSLLGFVGNHPLNVLVNSGCSTNFVSTMLVSKLRLPTQQSVEAFQVELADGSYLQCNKKIQQLEFQIQDYKDQLGFSVMPLSHYDMILGQSWLYQYDPIISFRDHSIRLFHRNQEVELRGLFNTQPITMVSAMQVKRLARKRDCTTASVMLCEAEDDTKNEYLTDKDFGDVFRALKSLNPTPAEMNMFASYTVMDELLYYLDRICVPHNRALRKILIQEHHEVPFAAHRGIDKTYRLLSATYFWPQMQQDVIKYVKACHSCQIISAYHPQTDGQTKRVNQILEEMLRHYIQNRLASWEEYLPLVEFAYNNAPHSVTGMTPFQAAYGHTPLVPTNFVLQHKVALADYLVQEMQDNLVQVRDKLIHVQQKYQKQTNKP